MKRRLAISLPLLGLHLLCRTKRSIKRLFIYEYISKKHTGVNIGKELLSIELPESLQKIHELQPILFFSDPKNLFSLGLYLDNQIVKLLFKLTLKLLSFIYFLFLFGFFFLGSFLGHAEDVTVVVIIITTAIKIIEDRCCCLLFLGSAGLPRFTSS